MCGVGSVEILLVFSLQQVLLKGVFTNLVFRAFGYLAALRSPLGLFLDIAGSPMTPVARLLAVLEPCALGLHLASEKQGVPVNHRAALATVSHLGSWDPIKKSPRCSHASFHSMLALMSALLHQACSYSCSFMSFRIMPVCMCGSSHVASF